MTHQFKPTYGASRIEDMVLTLLGAFWFENCRVWKGCDFEVKEAFHSKGPITDPNRRSESVHLTETGMLCATDLAARMFGGESWMARAEPR